MSRYRINKFTGGFDNVGVEFYSGSVEPTSPSVGMLWISTANNNLYVYYDSNWWCIGTLSTGNNNAGIPIGLAGNLILTY